MLPQLTDDEKNASFNYLSTVLTFDKTYYCNMRSNEIYLKICSLDMKDKLIKLDMMFENDNTQIVIPEKVSSNTIVNILIIVTPIIAIVGTIGIIVLELK